MAGRILGWCVVVTTQFAAAADSVYRDVRKGRTDESP
jgi:hypothetical protein